jgi:glutaredoxin
MVRRKTMRIVMYSRPGCHLCEQTADWLETLGVAVSTVDVDADPALAREYGLRVPVVVHDGRVVVEGRVDFATLADRLTATRRRRADG